MRRIRPHWICVLAALALLSACSNDDGGGSTPGPTRTATRTAVVPTIPATSTATIAIPATIPATSTVTPLVTAPPSATPTSTVSGGGTATPSGSTAFSALVVVRGDLPASAGDALGAPPTDWRESPGGSTFDRALSYARWKIAGPVERTGETSADGSIDLDGLPAGSYSLELNKSVDGNLVAALVAFHVGSGGRATLVIEIAQGLVRATNAWDDDGTAVREITSPYGSHVVIRDGVIRELSGSGRSYVDADGDGSFDGDNCDTAPGVWLCKDDRTTCEADRVCTCAGSCPLCEDCPVSVCVPPGVSPYACSGDQPCANPGDRCVCVSSCPECDDCVASTCVPSKCDPAQIVKIDAIGPSVLVVGQSGSMSATARLSDGWSIDVTQLVEWSSSDAATVAVDGWGSLQAKAIGTADVSAKLATLESEPWSVEVKDRPALLHLYVQNLDCIVVYGVPNAGPDAASPPPFAPGTIPPPDCRQVVRVGSSLHYYALGEFENGYYENVTSKVTWSLDPAGVGVIDSDGVFSAVQAGTTTLRASLEDVTSDGTEIKVVDQPTIVALQIFPSTAIPRPGPFPPDDAAPGDAFPCYDCGYATTLLKGDHASFHATAAYDTGEWEDVTERVTWSSSNTDAAPISAAGDLTAAAAGESTVTASLGDVTSNPVTVKVVETATLLGLSIYQESIDRVVEKGDEIFFHAFGYYDVGFDRDATDDATWKTSDASIATFTRAGVFLGVGAGTVEVWAELGGVESNHLSIEVFQTSSLDYCDAANINRAEWSDAFNRVVLESDCASYTPPAVASLRFTVTERERPGGIFDPCLDLYVYRGDQLVRTVRQEGCGQPFLPAGAPEYDQEKLKYQSLAFWDLKDDKGDAVAPGTYTLRGIFYLYYDPIIELPLVVGATN